MRNSVLETDGQTDSGTSAGVELLFAAKNYCPIFFLIGIDLALVTILSLAVLRTIFLHTVQFLIRRIYITI